MNNTTLGMLVGAAALLLSTAPALPAAAPMPELAEPETIQMNAPEYETHTKPLVEFKHRSHTSDFPQKYPQFFENGCGTCHHDDEGQPRTDLAPGGDVNYCIDCHSEPGAVPREIKREMRAQDLTRSEKKTRELEYHAEAVHDLCRGCHRKVRKFDRTTKAPTTCMKCHTKDES
jgi:hypothetical protein